MMQYLITSHYLIVPRYTNNQFYLQYKQTIYIATTSADGRSSETAKAHRG
eukprot:TRINITY_DN5217_c0_g1_i1.p2 TRINITY_DN5217_c0_g1~~TRINITY_DN5217_c0_g1_i1.p2  ORF type:complete len:50 (+),score=12.69 TRINITY_DN5217_c0_g1_i1:129-278(+)